jgi:hypothetical protein
MATDTHTGAATTEATATNPTHQKKRGKKKQLPATEKVPEERTKRINLS